VPERSHQAQEAYLAALLEPDPARARTVVRDAVREGLPIDAAYAEVLGPAMIEVGRRWEAGEIGVAHEHLAAEVTGALVSELGERLRGERATGRLAVVSCSPNEHHCLGGQMLGGMLEAAGWEVLYLGASLPVEDLIGLAEDEAADVIALSTTMRENLPHVQETIEAVQRLEEPPLVLVGGQAYDNEETARRVGADAWAASAVEAPLLLSARLPAAG
jgi:methanogenic corrinoid protein MtbC1